MSEGHRLERKTSWHNDHLKSVCAFANADGGTLEIGRDDDGKVVGVGAQQRRRLLEELPNKLRDLLGIVAPMDVREDDGVPCLHLVVEPYPSQPYNPDIANAFFWAGEIESWGREIDRVLRACRKAGTPEPETRLELGGLLFEFRVSDDYLESVGVARKRAEDSDATSGGPGRGQVEILRKALSDRPMTELMTVVRRKNRTKFRNQILRPLLDAGWIEMTIPDKPRSRSRGIGLRRLGRKYWRRWKGVGEGGRYTVRWNSEQEVLPIVRSPLRELSDE